MELRVGGAAADGGLVCQCGCDGAGSEMGGNGGRSRCRRCGKTFAFAFIGIIIGSNTRFRQKRQNTGESTQTFLFNLIPFDGIVVYQIWVGYGYLLVGYLTLFIPSREGSCGRGAGTGREKTRRTWEKNEEADSFRLTLDQTQ